MQAAAFWNKMAQGYAASPIKDTENYEKTLERVRHWLKPEMHVLEIGCGTGSTALRLAGDVSAYLATDLSQEMIRIAQDKLERADLTGLRFAVAEAGEAGREGALAVAPEAKDAAEPVDAVLAFNLLHLCPDLDATLAAVRGQLKEGGLFLSKTPCLSRMWYLKPVLPVLSLLGKAPDHVGFHSPETLEAAIGAAGFEILETADYPPKVPSRFVVARALPLA